MNPPTDISGVDLWSLTEGVEFCRWLEQLLVTSGFHCAIGGGVLINGASSKDLDVFIYPHYKETDQASFAAVEAMLPEIGIENLKLVQFYKDNKTVFSGDLHGKRIDFFFVA